MRFVIASVAALAFTLPALASAHTRLEMPKPLTQNDNAKSGPCGCYFGAPEDPNEDLTPEECPGTYDITELTAGSQVQIAWMETVNHNGAFRLSFSNKPVDQVTKADMEGGIVYDEPDMNTDTTTPLTTTVTVPNEACDNCTLQLRQDMGNSFYYSCAAVRIVAEGTGGGSATTTTTGSGAGGDPSTSSTGAGGAPASSSASGFESSGAGMADPPPAVDTSGSCNVPASPGKAGFGLALLGAALAFTLRRTRRS